MGGNVQCPVCTLYLLPGMDLSDHLETHPKEQVIKALVQMSLKSETSETIATTIETSRKLNNLSEADDDQRNTEDERSTPLSDATSSMRINSPNSVEISKKRNEEADNGTNSGAVPNVLLNRQSGQIFENSNQSSSNSSNSFFGPPTPYYYQNANHHNHHHHHQQQQQQPQIQQQNHHHYNPFQGHPHSINHSAMGHQQQPPMRLFSYQPSPKPLQPPPAYGAAISQLRSQNSQNVMVNNMNRPPYSPGNYTSTSPSTSTSTSSSTTPSRIPPPLPPPPLSQRYQGHFSPMEHSNETFDEIEVSNRKTMTPPIRPPPQLYRSPQLTSAGQYLRQSSSPYSVMTGSPSVLRYAESPVTAHYLERENGDFIVQETPKHVVECVEKDDGEFSVIERVYHMPPSVVQINEDEIDDLSEHDSMSENVNMLDDDRPSETWSNSDQQEGQNREQKKSGITVLSDVQLDISEYLDLVGNIIASGKVAKHRNEIIKIEKFEVEEVKEENTICLDDDVDDEDYSKKEETIEEDLMSYTNKIKYPSFGMDTPVTPVTTSVIRLAANPNVRSTTPSTETKFEEQMQTENNNAPITENDEILPLESGDIKSAKCEDLLLEKVIENAELKSDETISPTSNKSDMEELQISTSITKTEEEMPTTSEAQVQPPLAQEEMPKSIEKVEKSNLPEKQIKTEVIPVPLPFQQSIKRPIKKMPKKLIIKPKNKDSSSNKPTNPTTTEQATKPIAPTSNEVVTLLDPQKVEDVSKSADFSMKKEEENIKTECTTIIVSDPVITPLFADSNEKLPPDDDVQPSTSGIVSIGEGNDLTSNYRPDEKSTTNLTAFLDQCMKKETESEEQQINSIFGLDISGPTTSLNEAMTPPPASQFPSPSLFAKPLTNSDNISIPDSVLLNSDEMNEGDKNQLQHQQQAQNQPSYVEYPFSFLYGGEANQQEDDKNNINAPIYCSEDFNKYSASTNGGNSASCTWYQSQSSENDFEIDGKGSYLDLDSCKRSTSFAAATEGSMPTNDTLNIRTDEKMPAKGEISEQESNCGVENSWSQPLYNEFSVRFINPYENFTSNQESWSHDQYFRPQDLSSSVETKNFDLRLTEEPPLLDVLPSTSKRKNKAITKVPRKKTFQCTHCNTHFPLLKEKNAHMIKQHGYKRVNRRLIRDPPTSTVTTATITTIEASASLLLGLEANTIQPSLVEDNDSKAAIVKIEQENQESKKNLSSLSLTTKVTTTSSTVSRTKYDSMRARDNRMLISFNLNALNVKNEGKNDVEVHNYYTESKSSFCCFVCKRDFLTVKLFDEHLVEHPAECFTCHKKFTRWKNFMVHLKRHLGWKDFGCTYCDKKFVIRSALVEHMRMHTGQTPLKCKFCNKSFKRYSNLTQHRKRHGKKISRTKEYVCFCGEVLPSKARFIWHKETHDVKPKCCPYCRDRFVHANSLRRHIRLAHSDKFDYTEPMECPMCKQIYAKSSIKAHMATHSMDTQHECLICSKSFSTKWNLKIHSWVHANRTTKPFKCDQCVKAFVREVDYNNHMNSHKQIKPYTCEHCGCKFIRKYNYIRHRREHHGKKKFTCDLCGKLFHRHYYLIEHRRIHTGERPFQCTICGKSSTTKTNHNKHLKIHHSRDPFTSEA